MAMATQPLAGRYGLEPIQAGWGVSERSQLLDYFPYIKATTLNAMALDI